LKVKKKDIIQICEAYEELIDYLHDLNREQRKKKYNTYDERMEVVGKLMGFRGGITGSLNKIGISNSEIVWRKIKK